MLIKVLSNRWFGFLVGKKFLPLLGAIIASLGVSAYLGYLFPQLIAELFDAYAQKELFWQTIQTLVAIYLMEYVNRFVYSFLTTRYIQIALLDIRLYCYAQWLASHGTQRSKTANREFSQGEVLARLMNDTDSIGELISSGALNIVTDVLFVSSCLYSFMQIDQFSGLFLLGVEVVAIIALICASRSMARAYLRVRKEMGILSRIVADITQGIQENFYNEHGQFARKKIKGQFQKFLHEQLKANILDASHYSIAESLYPLFLAMAGVAFSHSPLVVGGVVAAMLDLIQRSIEPIKNISGKMSSIQRAIAGIRRIDDFIGHLQGQLQTQGGSEHRPLNFHSLKVHVDEFYYPARRTGEGAFALKNICFEGKRGELLGIVGLSGSGKSTLLKILACELLAEKGGLSICEDGDHEISFDFQDISKLHHYRSHISIVSQDSHIFTASLAFNIAMSSSHDRGVEEFWQSMQGEISYLQTWGIGPGDQITPRKLSLGQKQLVSALRACYLKRPVVLFDEISAGLDSALEMALRKVILLVQRCALTLIVAHRIETLLGAHKLLVMDGGRLVAAGSHRELIERNALYQSFVEHLPRLGDNATTLGQNAD